jgi:hypothetical protein
MITKACAVVLNNRIESGHLILPDLFKHRIYVSYLAAATERCWLLLLLLLLCSLPCWQGAHTRS